MNNIEYLKLLSAIRFHLDISTQDLQTYLNEQYADEPIRGLANLVYESNLNSIADIIRVVNVLVDTYITIYPQYNWLEIQFIKFYCKLNGIHNNKMVNPIDMYNQYQFLIHSPFPNNLSQNIKAETARLMLHFYFVLHLDFTELRQVLGFDDE